MEVYVLGQEGERHEDLVFEGVYTKQGLIKSHLIPVGKKWGDIFEVLDKEDDGDFMEFNFVDKQEYEIKPEEELIIMSDKGCEWCDDEFGDDGGVRSQKIAKVKVRN